MSTNASAVGRGLGQFGEFKMTKGEEQDVKRKMSVDDNDESAVDNSTSTGQFGRC
jgi:hypothetical protein